MADTQGGNGLTLLQGVNELVESVGEFPTGTLPNAGGTSIYSRARDILERETKRVLSQGWPENTNMTQKKVPHDSTGGTSFYIELGSDVLQIRAAGRDSHRDLTMRQNTVDKNDGAATDGQPMVYDANKATFDMGSTDDVYIDEVVNIPFAWVSPPVQDVVLGRARMVFQRRVQGNMETDAALMQEYQEADVVAPRNLPDLRQPFNTRPAAAGRAAPPKKEG